MALPIYLFISPHLDDAVLSCGGLIYRLIKAQHRVVVVTTITADAPSNLVFSRLTQRNHASWGLGDSPFAARRLEDIQAVKELGAEYIHLGFLDVVYRVDADTQPLYTKNVVGIPVHPFDWDHYEPALRIALQSLFDRYAEEPSYIFSPLSLGDHVDHVIVRRSVETILSKRNMIYYEDFPYAAKLESIESFLRLSNNYSDRWRSIALELSPEEVEARVSASGRYRSQLSGLFPSPLERFQEIGRSRIPFLHPLLRFPHNMEVSRKRMASTVKTYLSRIGGERYWYCSEDLDLKSTLMVQ